jgi:hypothetical protein
MTDDKKGNPPYNKKQIFQRSRSAHVWESVGPLVISKEPVRAT